MTMTFQTQEVGQQSVPTGTKTIAPKPAYAKKITLDNLLPDIAQTSSIAAANTCAVLRILIKETSKNIARENISSLGNLTSVGHHTPSSGSGAANDVSETKNLSSSLPFQTGKYSKEDPARLIFEKSI